MKSQAVEDGGTYLAAVANESAASERLATVGRFGRRKARKEHQAATEHTRTTRERVRDTWGAPPHNSDTLTEWATAAAERQAEHDPRVIDTAHALAAAQTEQAALKDRHDSERLALLAQELGAERVRRDSIRARLIHPEREASDAQTQAAEARREAENLRALPPEEAAARIEAKRATAEEQARQRAADRERQLRGSLDRTGTHTEPNRDSPRLSL